MVVNELKCCGNNSLKMVVSEAPTTKISFVPKNPFVVDVDPLRPPYTLLNKLRFF
jgi:hypothetical protein